MVDPQSGDRRRTLTSGDASRVVNGISAASAKMRPE